MATDKFCANSDSGDHRYFVFKTFEVYEPIKTLEVPADIKSKNLQTLWDYINSYGLYEKIEYAVLGCNCGSVIKKVVE